LRLISNNPSNQYLSEDTVEFQNHSSLPGMNQSNKFNLRRKNRKPIKKNLALNEGKKMNISDGTFDSLIDLSSQNKGVKVSYGDKADIQDFWDINIKKFSKKVKGQKSIISLSENQTNYIQEEDQQTIKEATDEKSSSEDDQNQSEKEKKNFCPDSSMRMEEDKIKAFEDPWLGAQAGGIIERRSIISLNSTPYTFTTESKKSRYSNRKKEAFSNSIVGKGKVKGRRKLRKIVKKIKIRK